MKKTSFLSVFIIFMSFISNGQNTTHANPNEQAYSKLFKDFLNQIRKNITANEGQESHLPNKNFEHEKTRDFALNKRETVQTDDINFLLSNYILAIEYGADTLSKTYKFNKISSEINNLYTFFKQVDIDNITWKPLRLYQDKYVYNKLSPFQQNNTLIFFDKTAPNKVLGYVLFVPGNQIKSQHPKILSWKLVFSYGKFFFEDILGQEGTEVFFEGVKEPIVPVSM